MSYYHSSYGNLRTRRNKKWNLKVLLIFILILLLCAIGLAWFFYNTTLKNNVYTAQQEYAEIFIPTSSNFEQVKEILYSQGVLINRQSFEWVSKWLKYEQNVKAGRYLIASEMNNLELVRLLRSGAQVPVMVTFNNLRDVNQLAAVVSQQIEADSADIAQLLHDGQYLDYLGYEHHTVPAMFIPDSYEFYWTTTAEQFVSRMFDEHLKFWNDNRKSKLEALNMTELEVSVLASIIEKETNKNDEKARMAGVYLNRLKGGWRLQADPTLVFAVGDFGIRRVLDVHKTIESPYNTYKYAGLPPGPICIPSIASIDAVLNYETHQYYYFCAKDDLSGYHAFAESLKQHELNAWKYRRALDRMNIKK